MSAGTSMDSRRRASTQRSRKKRATPQKRTALDAILDALPVAALHLDARETIRAVNPRAEELLGRALGDDLVDVLGSRFDTLLARGEHADEGRWVVGGETLCWERGALSLGRKGEEAIVIFMSLAERRKRDAQYADLAAKVDALSRSQAVVEFGLDGTLLSANQNFLDTFGYRLDEVEGAPHRKFMPDDDARSPAYAEFWQRIRRGESASGEFLRVGKGGREIWLQATYSPNRAADGTLLKVVKHAVDITERKQRDADTAGQLAAIEASQAVVAFDLEGRLLHANELFLAAVGYRLDEVVGRHHSMFVDGAEREAPAYQEFWARLRAGEHVAGEFMRIRKDGTDLWIQASYTPIRDARGRPYKVVKYASDVTKRKLHEADFSSQIAAISSSQAVVELSLDGTVMCANANFLDAFGYGIDEVSGQHHAMFMPEGERRSQAYRAFWENLRAGRFVAGEFLRVGKGGREVYIQASYNPICDLRGRPYKVVKFATVVTERKRQDADYAGQIDAIRQSQAVIEFDVEGHILDANDRFLDVMGYERREVVGHHHAMFVARHEQQSEAYRRFWRDLAEGRSASGEFARIASDGREVFIQATYTPIRDERGRVFKVVKFATDVSQRKYKDRAIARHAAEATSAAQAAVSTASSTNRTVEQLGVSTHDVAKVLDVITAIASQTKLLALNATIEAARAGEAGKGFAVVAHEVKELAAETARATEDVGQKVQAIQGAARAVVSAISEIGASIDQVNAIQSSIAQAVEDQAQTSSAVAHGGGATRAASAA